MAVNGASVTMGALETLKTASQNYKDGLEAAIGDLKSALGNLSGEWQDPDYDTICEKTEALERAIAGAREVVEGELLPFVERKISILGEK